MQPQIATPTGLSPERDEEKLEVGGEVPPATSVPPPRGSFLRRHGVKTVASIVLAILFAWGLERAGLRLVPKAEQLRAVRWGWVAVHVALLMTIHVIRAVRWRHLLRPIAPEIGMRRVLAASWLGFFAILMLPLRAGEIVRPWLIRDGKRVTMSAALGTMGAERVIDGLVVTGVLAGALLFVPRLDPLPRSIGELNIAVATLPALGYGALALFVAAFGAMALFYFARDFARRMVHATIGRVSERLGERVAGIVEGIASGLHFLGAPRYALPFLGETVAYWGINAVLMWTLGFACGLPMSFGHACAVEGVLAVGILVPAGPGLFGAFQAATFGALAMYFPPSVVMGPGSVYVFLLYTVQFVWHIVAAIIAAALDPAMLRRGEQVVAGA